MSELELNPLELALNAARLMLGKGAEELTLLELLPEQRTLYDYVVIGNGRSDRQASTLVNEVYHFCKRHQIAHFPVEGELGWHVIDCHEVVVHGLTEETRGYYQLEQLWPGAKSIDFEALLEKLPDPDSEAA